VQYRLLGKSHLPVDQRPTTIITDQGATIHVNRTVAVVRDKARGMGADASSSRPFVLTRWSSFHCQVLEKGKEVHKSLEREIYPQVTAVETRTELDRIGLRILNMLVGLSTLESIGKVRELPVMGFVSDYLVLGIIDEIERRPIPGSSLPPSHDRRATLEHYFSPSKNKPPPRTYGYYIIDSKTRRVPRLPTRKQSLAARRWPVQCQRSTNPETEMREWVCPKRPPARALQASIRHAG
jgi:exonuclease V